MRGIGPFGVEVLMFEDLDNRPNDEDRVAGYTTLRHRFINAAAYDRIEVWTRHFCDGKKVDRMFASYEVPSENPATSR